MSDLADLRKDYMLRGLDEAEMDANPIRQFQAWFDAAVAANHPEPNAMTVATATSDGTPSARMTLLKGLDERGFVFYTNYDSRKGAELAANPRAALVFFWVLLERQVRVEGHVERVSAEESDTYFHSRPEGSQLGAWASAQSQVIASRADLEQTYRQLEQTYAGREVPRPPHWGGFRIVPERIEFWQGRASRLHDRLRYTREPSGVWRIERLAP
ncbi:MAG TPA: pyridoxamine 5'-phosphate oxidase [Ktedonobacterales bacterium]|jgi:pyridoxamine 5'-phosphate oxidase|nr:pyridoxamine 5'-phosphate oxidase [Ktedonobacterales bacterium]